MSENLVITIGRECGSGGRQIGQAVAERLGINFYDQELLTLAAKNSGMCEDIFRTHDEQPVSSLLYSLVMDTYSLGMANSRYTDQPLNQKVFLAQFNTIKELAEKESCVIVGRCADYALADHEHTVRIFICAEERDKIPWLMRLYGLNEAQARDKMIKTDKKRASYYNYYTNKKWGSVGTYDLCINTSSIGREKTVDMIIDFAKAKEDFWAKGRVDHFEKGLPPEK